MTPSIVTTTLQQTWSLMQDPTLYILSHRPSRASRAWSPWQTWRKRLLVTEDWGRTRGLVTGTPAREMIMPTLAPARYIVLCTQNVKATRERTLGGAASGCAVTLHGLGRRPPLLQLGEGALAPSVPSHPLWNGWWWVLRYIIWVWAGSFLMLLRCGKLH